MIWLMFTPYCPQSVSADLGGDLVGTGTFAGNLSFIPIQLSGGIEGTSDFAGDVAEIAPTMLSGNIQGFGTFRGNFDELFSARNTPARVRPSSDRRRDPGSVVSKPGRGNVDTALYPSDDLYPSDTLYPRA